MYERTDKMFVFTVKSRIKKPKRALVLAIFAILLIGGTVQIQQLTARPWENIPQGSAPTGTRKNFCQHLASRVTL